MTDADRAENARILLSHSEIKPQFFPHNGSTISDLYELVERSSAGVSPESERVKGILSGASSAPKSVEYPQSDLCPKCMDYQEISVDAPGKEGYRIVPCPECAQ